MKRRKLAMTVTAKARKELTKLTKALTRLTKAMRRLLKSWICTTMRATIREPSTHCFHSLCRVCREDECEFIDGKADRKKRKKKRKSNRRRATEPRKRRKKDGAKTRLSVVACNAVFHCAEGFSPHGSEGDSDEEEAELPPLPDVQTKCEGKKGVAIPIKPQTSSLKYECSYLT